MAKKLRVVIDTNIFISALLGGRTCRKIVDFITKGEYVLLFSESLIRETVEVLTNKDIGSISNTDVERLFKVIHRHTLFVHPTRPLTVCRDSGDNKILEIAVEGKADFVVTGDKDLLTLNPFEGIAILSPKEFLSREK